MEERKRKLWEAMFKGPPDACWLWRGKVKRDGYGVARVDRPRINGVRQPRMQVRVHRFAYEMVNGPVPNGLFVLHSCHNPCCYNPAHLRPGTHQDNMNDMKRAGRWRGPYPRRS